MIAEALATPNGNGARHAVPATPPGPEPTTAQPAERDARGRFLAGNKGGPGNPYARQVAQLKQALLDAVGPEDVAVIARALVAKAKEGNVQAARLVFTYVLGKPSPPVDPDRLDAVEWQNLKETGPMLEEVPSLINKPAPEFPLTMVRESRPAIARELSRTFSRALLDPERAEEILGFDGEETAANGDREEAAIVGEAAASPPFPLPRTEKPGVRSRIRQNSGLDSAALPNSGEFGYANRGVHPPTEADPETPTPTTNGDPSTGPGDLPGAPTVANGSNGIPTQEPSPANGSNGAAAVEAWLRASWEEHLNSVRGRLPSGNGEKRSKRRRRGG